MNFGIFQEKVCVFPSEIVERLAAGNGDAPPQHPFRPGHPALDNRVLFLARRGDGPGKDLFGNPIPLAELDLEPL